jgi:hypothetical protein
MNTNDFFQYLVRNDATKDLAAQLASAYLQRASIATPAAA